MMAEILYRPTLLDTLRHEVDPVVGEGFPNLEYRLEQQCPHLRAVFLEILRLTASSSTLRGVVSTTELGDKILRGGTTILIPYRQLHLDAEVFGEDLESFDPDCFLNIPGLSKSHSFRPFGGGKTYCSGRFLAEREVLTFVALAISRFDIDVVNRKGTRQNPRFQRLEK